MPILSKVVTAIEILKQSLNQTWKYQIYKRKGYEYQNNLFSNTQRECIRHCSCCRVDLHECHIVFMLVFMRYIVVS